jgi:hypothetical protein
MSVNQKAYIALNTFATSANEAVKRLRETFIALGITTAEAAEPIVTAWASERHGCPLVEGQRKAKGRMVLNASAPTYEAAKTSRRRAMEALTGDADAPVKSSRGEREEIEVPAHIAKLAAALAAACSEYEGAKRLAALAVSEAFAK